MTPAADRPRITPMGDAFERKARRILNDILEQREVKRSGTVDFAQAMQIVAEVMRQGTASHPDNDWLRRQQEYYIRRVEAQLRLVKDGDQQQDHISHAATRLLMALTLREVA